MFPPEQPTAQFPYQVLEQVGVGSMGIVYRAVEVDLGRTVAIKTLRPSMLEEEPPEIQEEMRQRFLQEAQAAGRISHPGVTVVYRVGREGEVPFMVMEWLEGDSLEERMKQRGRLMPIEGAKLAAELLEALEAAHKVGVVHRDIKPSNLVLLDDGRIKVTDFGIARIQGHDLVKTQAGVVLATPKFASPEQLRGVEVDGRADLFAAGVLLYHVLSGRFPFEGNSFMELANAILQNEPPPLRQVVPDLPHQLEAITHRALRKERQDRYRGAAQMAEELRAYLMSEATGHVPVQTQADPMLETAHLTPIVRHLPRDAARALATIVRSWPDRALDRQATSPLLERLLERPLHADPFAGALVVDDLVLLVENGVLLGAIHQRDGTTGDRALAKLPELTQPKLHPLPETLPPGSLSVLTSIIHPPDLLQSNLDSSFINLPGLAQKLKDERFDGLLRLLHGGDWGLVAFVGGKAISSYYSEGWSRIPIDQTWQRWVSDHPVRAQVEKRCIAPPAAWFRRAFGELAYEVAPMAEGSTDIDTGGSTSTRLRQFFSSSRTNPYAGRLAARLAADEQVGPVSGMGIRYERAPANRFFEWMIRDLPRYLAERELFGRWKYLAEWLFLVRKAKIYHELPRPGSRDADPFDLVTFDENDKVLHIAHRLDHATADTFAALHERIITAKTARKKTGDVGGAFYIARHFDDAVLSYYKKALHTASSGSWFGVEESFTGYEGFVRIGPRRGFHLLLVQENDDGFEPLILPSS